MRQLEDGHIVIGPVRFSYLTVFKPKMNDMKTPPKSEYSVVLLIPKEPNDHLADPREEIKGIAAVINKTLGEKFNGVIPKVWNNPLKDGDKELKTSDGQPKAPGYWFINTACDAEYAPLLRDGDKKPVTSGWNSGDHGMVKLRPYAYDHKSGQKGVSFGLKAIQFLYKDESLGGAETTDEGFVEVPDASRGRQSSDQASSDGSPDWDPFAEE